MANEVWFLIEKSSEGYPKTRDWEGLHCDVVDQKNETFKIKNVPFYLSNVAYDDIVYAKRNPAGYLEFDRIELHSGWSVYRLLVLNELILMDTINKLESMGLKVEEENSLIAFAVPPHADSDEILDFILAGKKQGKWGAQDGFISE